MVMAVFFGKIGAQIRDQFSLSRACLFPGRRLSGSGKHGGATGCNGCLGGRADATVEKSVPKGRSAES